MIGKDAGDAYSEAAKLYKRADHSNFEAAQAFEKAAKSYKKVSPKGTFERIDAKPICGQAALYSKSILICRCTYGNDRSDSSR